MPKKREPKPCPFCGMPAAIWLGMSADGSELVVWKIECSGRHCPTQPHLQRTCRAAAVAAWNRRAK